MRTPEEKIRSLKRQYLKDLETALNSISKEIELVKANNTDPIIGFPTYGLPNILNEVIKGNQKLIGLVEINMDLLAGDLNNTDIDDIPF